MNSPLVWLIRSHHEPRPTVSARPLRDQVLGQLREQRLLQPQGSARIVRNQSAPRIVREVQPIRGSAWWVHRGGGLVLQLRRRPVRGPFGEPCATNYLTTSPTPAPTISPTTTAPTTLAPTVSPTIFDACLPIDDNKTTGGWYSFDPYRSGPKKVGVGHSYQITCEYGCSRNSYRSGQWPRIVPHPDHQITSIQIWSPSQHTSPRSGAPR